MRRILRLVWGRSFFFRSDVRNLTSELISMLRPDYDWQADVLKGLQHSVERGDLAEAERRFSSGDIWGGSGSVSDVSFSDPLKDERKCKLLRRLVMSFARAGITYAPASEMAAIYKSWIRQGVFAKPTA